jgi:hypothetical protein
VILTPLEQRALQIAKRLIGQREATGHNDGWLPRLVQRFVAKGAAWLDRQPWCCCFALYCVKTAAKDLGLVSVLPLTASTSQLYHWYRDKGGLLTHPKPGCIGMVKGGPTGHHHTFLVHDVQGGYVIGVDGNWRNAVTWTKRRIVDCDYGPIC